MWPDVSAREHAYKGPRMAIYGYCRVSTILQADDGESLGVQERQIQGWCMMQGEDLAHLHIERGVSGSVPLGKRPEGSAMMAALKAGDTIVTSRLDRLFRSALDALQTVEAMQKRKIRVVIIDGLGDITGNGMAKAFLTISAAFAELERDTIRERVSTVKADQRKRGRYLGGAVPFGYSRTDDGDLVHNDVEQKIIARVKALRKGAEPGKVRSLRWLQGIVKEEFDRVVSLPTLQKIVSNAPSGVRRDLDGELITNH